MKKTLVTLAIIILAIFSSCDLGLEMVKPGEGSVNAYIYPYMKFELSEDLTYYTATVVAGANLEILYVPGEYHTDFGTMPIKKFNGYRMQRMLQVLGKFILLQTSRLSRMMLFSMHIISSL